MQTKQLYLLHSYLKTETLGISAKGWIFFVLTFFTLSFSVLSGLRSMNQVFPLERAAEAFDRMMSGKARFRGPYNRTLVINSNSKALTIKSGTGSSTNMTTSTSIFPTH
ncbi:MAG: hypothetical protein WAJ93_14525 [Candidatus Nitrosopolaris sp.]